MASKLLTSLKILKQLIDEKSNREFKRNAIDQINPEKVDEDILPAYEAPEEPVEAAVDEHPAEEEIEAEFLSIEAAIRKSISEEEEATAKYIERAKEAMKHNNPVLEALFRELASDEIVHAASLRAALHAFGLIDKRLELKGLIEFADVTGENITEASIEQEEEALVKQAEKEKKEFDFVKEYTKNKSEYNKELVVGAINNLIAGKADLASTVDKIMKDGKVIAKEDKKAKNNKKEDKKGEKA